MTATVAKLGRVRLLGVRVLALLPPLAYSLWRDDIAADYTPILGWIDDAIVWALAIIVGKK